jgi:hypothetical protein
MTGRIDTVTKTQPLEAVQLRDLWLSIQTRKPLICNRLPSGIRSAQSHFRTLPPLKCSFICKHSALIGRYIARLAEWL